MPFEGECLFGEALDKFFKELTGGNVLQKVLLKKVEKYPSSGVSTYPGFSFKT